MEVQDQESLGRWDGLGSRDASSRTAAMEHIRQEVMKKIEAIRPLPASAPSPPASPPNSDLNDVLAHLLMLSRRCPYEDVKERCIRLLKAVQVGDSYSYIRAWWASLFKTRTRLFHVLSYSCLWCFSADIYLSSLLYNHCKHCAWVRTFLRPMHVLSSELQSKDMLRHHELINT